MCAVEDEAACHECVCGCGRCVVAPMCVCVWVSSDLHRLEEVGGHGRGEEAGRAGYYGGCSVDCMRFQLSRRSGTFWVKYPIPDLGN